ncbi:MAG: type II secretion system protein [Nitrospirae bacterium]|nr:type II secretion system protein [Nitrospirota bacterium]
MKILRNEKGFTLIELVLIIVILGILGAVASVQFGTIIRDADTAALDSGSGSYNAQLALTINTLRVLPTATQFATQVFDAAKPSGGKVAHTNGVAGGVDTITMTINATCVDTWTYSDSTTATPGRFVQATTSRAGC